MDTRRIAPGCVRCGGERVTQRAAGLAGRSSLRVLLRRGAAVLAAATGPMALWVSPALSADSAQAYPTRPVRILVPLTPGGNMDGISRALAQKLTEAFGQQVIVDNRPGAGSRVALEILHAAAADGHTIMTTSMTPIIHPMLYKSRFELLRDFAPVSQVSAQGYVLIVNNAVPARSASELVQHMKANPGKLSYMSTGIGSPIHLTGELFQSATGTRMLHVPYKGAAYADIASGLVQVAFPAVASAMPFIQTGRVRPLAVTTPKRLQSLPDLPTLNEDGAKGVVVVNWYGIIAPRDTPRALIERLSKQIAAGMHSPEVEKRLRTDGTEPVGSSPSEFTAHIRAEAERWGGVIRQAGIRPE
jgi:tripartite-type tricarboxylate transporter receptor subunit TctC